MIKQTLFMKNSVFCKFQKNHETYARFKIVGEQIKTFVHPVQWPLPNQIFEYC